ncbi:hypothetical protein HYPSUDRAFT_76496 [Hypholoma sublateritium FD-334 SS-4]|uniref:Uncharacterized protein n=1 Tax=Hypholoma sublateritium (strain FD-334 SS-4) TaxID=945553 RepID=A0A0D2PYD5_HYPSF|nr:hypothetical protein HYPSUDRAFT_76496 [Hypholoma sublateritium FD-334 SS-4]
MLVRNTFVALVVLVYGSGAASVPRASDVLAESAVAPPNVTAVNGTLANGFSIDIGVGNRGTVAWVGGLDPCRGNVPVAPLGVRECGRVFSINGQGGFTLEGCESNLFISQFGRFWGSCGRISGNFPCDGISARFHCA